MQPRYWNNAKQKDDDETAKTISIYADELNRYDSTYGSLRVSHLRK